MSTTEKPRVLCAREGKLGRKSPVGLEPTRFGFLHKNGPDEKARQEIQACMYRVLEGLSLEERLRVAAFAVWDAEGFVDEALALRKERDQPHE